VTAAEHQRYQEDIGAYLLGALTTSEHDDFQRHLSTCHVCQDELDRLSTAADALPRAVEQYEPPAALKRALMEQVYAEAEPGKVPRRSFAERIGLDRFFAGLSPQFAAAAAAVVLAVGVGAGYALWGTGGSDGGTRTVAAAVDSTRVGSGQAKLVVAKDGAGGQLQLTAMPQPRPGQIYQVWLDRGDQIEPGPLFSVDSNGNGVAAVPGSLDGVKRVMVTRERAGGARQPTEAPVVTAPV
jgi:anti-sigma-K factor RskA